MNKPEIITAVRLLLASAESRKTKQGVFVFKSVLKDLEAANSRVDVKNALEKLNRALVGIEAHGHLTNEEHLIATQLRGD